MRIRVSAVFFLIFFAACASRPPLITPNTEWFSSRLLQGDLTSASRFEWYFHQLETGIPEVDAQYYLTTCQPRRAYQAIEKVSDPKEKSLFLGVLAELVSAERKSSKPSPFDDVESLLEEERYPASDEIFADEWRDLRFTSFQCDRMPLVANEAEREKFKDWAKETFATFPERLYDRDPVLSRMAVELGVRRSEQEYFARDFSVKEAKGSLLALSALDIGVVDAEPRSFAVPMLLSGIAMNTPETEVEVSIHDLGVKREKKAQLEKGYGQKVVALIKEEEVPLRACVQKHVEQGRAELTFELNIDGSGKGSATLLKSSVFSSDFENCVTNVLLGIHYPTHPLKKFVRVVLPINLERKRI